MPHLIDAKAEPFDVPSFCDELQKAHDYLAGCGSLAVKGIGIGDDIANWGTAMKRIKVSFPEGARPSLISKHIDTHNLVEVINQCATLERLLDCLRWVSSDASGLSQFVGVRCHPTTSSGEDDGDGDNDLVLRSQVGQWARFEVSDVASGKDGNGKEGKDLVSLGAMRCEGKGKFRFDGVTWPSNSRLFLVVAEEFAAMLRRPTRAWLKGRSPYCHYIEVKGTGRTRIFEVVGGCVPVH